MAPELLVSRVASFGFEDCRNASRHTGDEVQAYLPWNLSPFLLDPLPEFLNAIRLSRVGGQPPFQMAPEVLYRVEIRRLQRLVKDVYLIVAKPLQGQSGRMFGVVVLLKDNLALLKPVDVQGLQEVCAEDLCVELSIHGAVNSATLPDTS